MEIALWTSQAALAFVFAGGGIVKMLRPRKELADSGMTWVDDFSDGGVKAIAALEVLAGIALILPAVTGIAPVLVPLAASGVVLLMVGAAIVHARRDEVPFIGVIAVLLAVAAFVAWGRFGPYAF